VRFEARRVEVNGQPGRLLIVNGRIDDVLSIDVADDVIQAVRIVRNPEKLAHLSPT
jgi:RNA polymerase sigma-70 factor (ECF subfamily)